MARYIAHRILLLIPTLLLLSLAVFSLLRLIPGDAVVAQIAQGGVVPQSNMDAVRKQLGLDQPFAIQYLRWVGSAARGNLGKSLISHRPVTAELFKSLRVTAELAILAIMLSIALGIPFGILAAVKHNSPLDHVVRVLSISGVAVPDFWLGTIAILVLSVWLHYLPPSGFVPFFSDPLKNLSQVWLPVCILGVRLSAVTTRMTRSMTLDVLHQDYVRTAVAKGLSNRTMLQRHALKNALIPVVTVIGNQVGVLMAGALIMETLFSLPGLGQLTLISIQQRDYAQLQGNVLVLGIIVMMVNLLVDVLYARLDPRIHFS
jgi:peptide/nickel transport system permease protein